MRNQRQSVQPNQYPTTQRPIAHRLPTSFDPGLENPVSFIHVLREEGVRGQCSVSVQMAEMPKPLLNSVSLRVRAWFVPYTAYDRFPTLESFFAAWAGEPERPLMDVVPVFNTGTISASSEISLVSGLQFDPLHVVNIDFVEAYNTIINNERTNTNAILGEETQRDLDDHTIARATHINSMWSDVKPTFDAASVEGIVPVKLSGSANVQGIGTQNPQSTVSGVLETGTLGGQSWVNAFGSAGGSTNRISIQEDPDNPGNPKVMADLSSAVSNISLAEMDRGRVIAQLARIRDRFAGHEEVRHIDALMSGWSIPYEAMRKPMLLNEQRVQFNTMERPAMDGPSLGESVTKGVASATMSVTLPATSTGGYIVVTATAQPDQIFERRQDPMLYITSVDQMPDAFRDTIDIHKVDVVTCGEVDLTHSTPDATYGYSPRHMRFARPVDRVGGKFRDIPANAENRASLWLYNTTDPVYGQSHHLCPKPFPKDVFADTLADSFEARVVVGLVGSGITQFGPQVLEDQGSYAALIESLTEEEPA